MAYEHIHVIYIYIHTCIESGPLRQAAAYHEPRPAAARAEAV